MESMFNDSWGFLIIGAGMALLRLVPAALIFTAGVMAVTKEYRYSGSAIILSAVLSFLSSVITGLGMFVGFALDGGMFSVWILQGFSALSGFLLAGGILGIVSSLPQKSTSATGVKGH
jgi:hypothetical protein